MRVVVVVVMVVIEVVVIKVCIHCVRVLQRLVCLNKNLIGDFWLKS